MLGGDTELWLLHDRQGDALPRRDARRRGPTSRAVVHGTPALRAQGLEARHAGRTSRRCPTPLAGGSEPGPGSRLHQPGPRLLRRRERAPLQRGPKHLPPPVLVGAPSRASVQNPPPAPVQNPPPAPTQHVSPPRHHHLYHSLSPCGASSYWVEDLALAEWSFPTRPLVGEVKPESIWWPAVRGESPGWSEKAHRRSLG